MTTRTRNAVQFHKLIASPLNQQRGYRCSNCRQAIPIGANLYRHHAEPDDGNPRHPLDTSWDLCEPCGAAAIQDGSVRMVRHYDLFNLDGEWLAQEVADSVEAAAERRAMQPGGKWGGLGHEGATVERLTGGPGEPGEFRPIPPEHLRGQEYGTPFRVGAGRDLPGAVT